MRPRHYTAENGRRMRGAARDQSRFNEAAALHRGKRAEKMAQVTFFGELQ